MWSLVVKVSLIAAGVRSADAAAVDNVSGVPNSAGGGRLCGHGRPRGPHRTKGVNATAAWFNAPPEVEAYPRRAAAVGSGTHIARRHWRTPPSTSYSTT